MKTTKLFFMAALALMTAACSNSDNDILTPAEQPANNMVTITAKLAPKSGSALTRAVADNDDNKITVTWAVDETLKIISANGHNATATITAVDGTTGAATISFTIDAAAKGQNCTIIYPADAAVTESAGEYTANPITAQDGTLKAALDVRIGKGTITDKTTPTLNVTTEPEAQFAIFKFTTKNAGASANIDVKPLTIKIGTQDYVITPASATSTLYAALPAVSSQKVTFYATGSGSTYTCSKDGVSFDAGKYYQSTLKMAISVSSITINNAPKEALFVNSKGTLTATVLPDNATDKTVTWSSDNPNHVKIDEATGEYEITGVDGYGSATITATAGSKKATCTITGKVHHTSLSAGDIIRVGETIFTGDKWYVDIKPSTNFQTSNGVITLVEATVGSTKYYKFKRGSNGTMPNWTSFKVTDSTDGLYIVSGTGTNSNKFVFAVHTK